MTQRVLVTGAAGFIGGHCCRALLDNAYEVLGVDNFDPFYDRTIKEQAIAELSGRKGFSFIEVDIRNAGVFPSLLDGVDVILHLAARAGVRPSIEQPMLYSSINVEGTVQLLEAARQTGIRRFVFGSSSSVYGDATPVPFREDEPALAPISPYAATKRAGELLCQVYTHLYGLRIASLRFFTVYGPRQRPDLAIHRFTRLLKQGSTIQQFGDGSTERDYTHIDDIVQGVLGAVTWTEPDEAAHEIFNLGVSRTVRLSYLIELIGAALRFPPRIEVLPPQPGDVKRTFADIGKARAVLGYAPTVKIEDGIPAFVKWYEDTYGRQSPTAT